jgi:hypothetical protein
MLKNSSNLNPPHGQTNLQFAGCTLPPLTFERREVPHNNVVPFVVASRCPPDLAQEILSAVAKGHVVPDAVKVLCQAPGNKVEPLLEKLAKLRHSTAMAEMAKALK